MNVSAPTPRTKAATRFYEGRDRLSSFDYVDPDDMAEIELELAKERARVAELVREVEYLRSYGNKDCTAMADAALRSSQ